MVHRKDLFMFYRCLAIRAISTLDTLILNEISDLLFLMHWGPNRVPLKLECLFTIVLAISFSVMGQLCEKNQQNHKALPTECTTYRGLATLCPTSKLDPRNRHALISCNVFASHRGYQFSSMEIPACFEGPDVPDQRCNCLSFRIMLLTPTQFLYVIFFCYSWMDLANNQPGICDFGRAT